MLWYIENTPHRILGSIHLLPRGQTLPPWTHSASNGVGRIVFEADRERGAAAAAIGVDSDLNHLQLPGAPALYRRAEAILREVADSPPSILELKPWRAALTATMVYLQATSGSLYESGIEAVLTQQAHENELELGFLEETTRPFELFEHVNDCSDPPGLAELKRFVTDQSRERTNLERMQKAWLRSDLYDFGRIFAERASLDPTTLDALATQRNREWLPTALEMLRSDTPTLFAIGSLHTVGPGNFVELIEQADYKCRFHTEPG
jgi:uncharacterized protein YbaP (TraB family)